MASADSGLAAGSFSSSERIDCLERGGHCSVCQLGATGRVLMCWEMTEVGSSPTNGGRPVDEFVEHGAEGVEVGLAP